MTRQQRRNAERSRVEVREVNNSNRRALRKALRAAGQSQGFLGRGGVARG